MHLILTAMKKSVLFLIGALIFCFTYAAETGTRGLKTERGSTLKGTLTVTCSPDLSHLTEVWAGEFTKANPDVKINVVKLSAGARDFLTESGLAVVSSDYTSDPGTPSPWKMTVGRDIVVPVISSANPYAALINQVGISPAKLTGLINSGGMAGWGSLLGGDQNKPVTLFITDDLSVKSALAEYLGVDAETVAGIQTTDASGLKSLFEDNPYAMAFCNLSDVLTEDKSGLAGMVSLLPLDKNSNGKLDNVEGIYANVPTFLRGVWIGKYPRTLSRNVYALSPAAPVNETGIAFLKYIIADGQSAVEQFGLISLVPNERTSKADLLPIRLPQKSVSKATDPVQLIITLVLGLILIAIALTYALRFRRLNRPSFAARSAAVAGAMSEAGLNIPKGVYFDTSHTWAFMEADGTVKVGVDDFLQHITGKLTRIRMKKPGDRVIKGEAIVTFIQNGKQLIVKAPLSGVIKAENKLLFTDPSLLNQSPYNDGWVYQIEPTNWVRENQFLFMADKYTDWVQGEFRRLRDFLAMTIKPESPEFAYVTLQDGGEIADHVLSNMGPEVWEEFQTRFMDATK
ncbi:MAG: hypothetical protein A2X22_08025 [Bacteroidetes bacterium GWF2_49_14]|nr:MAG: hypothetical protein A2X22_08025 [Bacteroidetes bacterium GWF2_49_14]HBB91059.1 hypothetical protein [Bacteroidales bacterium]